MFNNTLFNNSAKLPKVNSVILRSNTHETDLLVIIYLKCYHSCLRETVNVKSVSYIVLNQNETNNIKRILKDQRIANDDGTVKQIINCVDS